MPILPRTSARLLRTVRNKQHASEVDHHYEPSQPTASSLPTPPTSSYIEGSMTRTSASAPKLVEVEDYTQDPLSSDEDEQILSKIPDLERLSRPVKSTNQQKRPGLESDSDDDIFGAALSGSQQKRAKTAAFRKPAKPTIKYGSQSSQSNNPRTGAKKGNEFKQTRVILPSKVMTKDIATFKTARGADVFAFGGAEMPSPTLSALSEPPDSPGFKEIEVVSDLNDKGLKTRCDICHEQVNLLVKQEYEDRFGRGQFHVRRQNAFCKYHKQNDARRIWQQRGYPEINWNRLEARMREQHPRLIKILEGRTPSRFRKELAKQIASREDRTIQTTYAGSTAASKLSAGYYGPRGQKLMLEHISAHLSDELREASLQDALLRSAGVGGGVSGVVQSILVPEMAVGLIVLDMHVDEDQAHQILAESKVLGETLHDEERERVPKDPDHLDNEV